MFARRVATSMAALLIAGGAAPPIAVNTDFGALTAEGAGGVPVNGSSLTGTNANHFQISGGRISPSATGDTANLNGGPYSFVTDNGQEIEITITADAYSVRTIAEEAAAASAAGSNKTIIWRDGTYPGLRALSTLTKTGLVITSETPLGAIFTGLTTISSVSGVTFKNKWKYTSGVEYALGDCVIEITSSTVTLDAYEIDGGSDLEDRDYWFEGIRSQGGAPTIKNGTIHHARTAIKLDDDIPGTDTITDNEFHHIYEDGIQFQDHDIDVQRNIFHTFVGRSGKRWGVAGGGANKLSIFTGTINVGDTLTNGSGTSKKVIVVAAVDQGAGTIDGYYNNYAFPVVDELFTGPTGTVTLGTQDNAFDGIHGDAIQGIDKTATVARDVTIKNNIVMRSEAYNHDALGNSNPQGGIFLPSYGPGEGGTDIGYGTVHVEGNIIYGVNSNGIYIARAADATVINNTVLQPEHQTSTRTTITFLNSVATCYGNIGDNGSSAVIKDNGGNTLTLTDYDGDNNGGVPLLRAGQLTPFPDLYTYPQSLTTFIPGVGSTPDTAKCGALLTDGEWRPTAMESPPVSLGLLDAPVNNFVTGSNTVTYTDFALSAGTNRRILVWAQWNKNGTDTRDTTGFSSATITSNTGNSANLSLVKAQSSAAASAFEGGSLYEIAEADLPAGGGPYDISLTANGAANTEGIGIRVWSIQGAPNAAQASPFGMFDGAVVTGDITGSITPTTAGSLVFGCAGHSSQSTGADWSAGLTEVSAQYVVNSTATMLLGSAIQGNSALTCTANYNGGRGYLILAAWAP